jgi:hypothetical protein
LAQSSPTSGPPSTDTQPPRPTDTEAEKTDAGTLLYRPTADGLGRELAGFAGVDDWAAMRDELIRRGHGVGALYHKPTYR